MLFFINISAFTIFNYELLIYISLLPFSYSFRCMYILCTISADCIELFLEKDVRINSVFQISFELDTHEVL